MRSAILTRFGAECILVLWSVVAAPALPMSTAVAGWYTWTGEGNSSQWANPANWLDLETDLSGVPSIMNDSNGPDVAIFDHVSPTVRLNHRRYVASIWLINGADTTLNVGDFLALYPGYNYYSYGGLVIDRFSSCEIRGQGTLDTQYVGDFIDGNLKVSHETTWLSGANYLDRAIRGDVTVTSGSRWRGTDVTINQGNVSIRGTATRARFDSFTLEDSTASVRGGLLKTDFLQVGDSPRFGTGFARLTVANAGRLDTTRGQDSWSATTSVIGYSTLGQSDIGEVVVAGSGSEWDSGRMVIGQRGHGMLTVIDGGHVDSGNAIIALNPSLSGPGDAWPPADAASGAVYIGGEGSRWTVHGDLKVAKGLRGHGVVTITDGAIVNSSEQGPHGRDSLGWGEQSTADVHIAGSHSQWTTDRLSVSYGLDSHSRIRVADGGRLITETVALGVNPGNDSFGPSVGEIEVVGESSLWVANDKVFLGGNESGPGGIGRLRVADGGTVVMTDDPLFMWSGGEITGCNDGFIVGTVRNVGGTVAPGCSIGSLSIDGDYYQDGGTLEIEIGAGGTEFDVLHVSGSASLNGTIDLIPLGDLQPGTQFAISDFVVAGGDLQLNNLLLAADDRRWSFDGMNISYSGGDLLADFDGDLDIDGEDFLIWQAGIGIATGATPMQGDADGDGCVDGDDFLAWQNEYSSLGGSSSVAVPELSSIGLMIVALLSAACNKRRCARSV